MSAASVDIGTSSSTQEHVVDSSLPFRLGEWRIDPAQRKATKENTVVRIDPRNLRVLQLLVDRRGEIVSQREIEQAVWEGVVVTPDSLYQSIRQLRHALGDTKDSAKYIETVPRKGYRLVARVARERSSEQVIASLAGSNELPTRPVSSAKSIRIAATVLAIAAVAFIVVVSFVIGRSDETTAVVAPRVLTEEREAMLDPKGPLDAPSLKQLGDLALMQGDAKEAIAFFERALQVQIASSGEHDEMVVELLSRIASTYLWLDDEVAARGAAERALAQVAAIHSSSPDRITTSTSLSSFMLDMGEYEKASTLVDEALRIAAANYGHRHMASSAPLLLKASIEHARGDFLEGEQYFREALALIEERRGKQEPRTAYAHTGLALLLLDVGKVAEAEQHARAALGILERSVRNDHPYIASAHHVLAEILLTQHRASEAEPVLRQEIDLLSSTKASDLRLGRASSTMGECMLQLGRVKEATELLAYAEGKLKRRKGWPIEREIRLLDERLGRLALRVAGEPQTVPLQMAGSRTRAMHVVEDANR